MSGEPANSTFAQDSCRITPFLAAGKIICWLALVALIATVVGCVPLEEETQQPTVLPKFSQLPTSLSNRSELCITLTSPVTNTTSVNEDQIPTNEWAVQLAPGVDPDVLAAEYDAINVGQIGSLPRFYLFRRPCRDPYDTDFDPLVEDPRVEWVEQQYKHKQSTRP